MDLLEKEEKKLEQLLEQAEKNLNDMGSESTVVVPGDVEKLYELRKYCLDFAAIHTLHGQDIDSITKNAKKFEQYIIGITPMSAK